MGILFSSLITVPFQELLGSVLWWYGAGFRRMIQWVALEWRDVEDHIHWKQWAGALFIPMYGQHDWKGRSISVFMRFVVLVYKTLRVSVWGVFHLLILVVYAVFPVVAAVMSAATLLAVAHPS